MAVREPTGQQKLFVDYFGTNRCIHCKMCIKFFSRVVL